METSLPAGTDSSGSSKVSGSGLVAQFSDQLDLLGGGLHRLSQLANP